MVVPPIWVPKVAIDFYTHQTSPKCLGTAGDELGGEQHKSACWMLIWDRKMEGKWVEMQGICGV